MASTFGETTESGKPDAIFQTETAVSIWKQIFVRKTGQTSIALGGGLWSPFGDKLRKIEPSKSVRRGEKRKLRFSKVSATEKKENGNF
jgi:hypothetical protein